MEQADDPRPALGLRRIINAAGTMTALGASAAEPRAVEAATAILPWFVEIDDLQRLASRAIAEATGAEAGTVTASASAGITLAVAGCMTGVDPERIARLPEAAGMPDRVLIQSGHLIDYGAPLEQAIRLAGARVVPIGEPARADTAQLAAALDAPAAAALYVISHHTRQSGQIDLAAFAALCRDRDVPVVVDAASEYDLTGPVAAGADLVVYSAHKFLGGLTAGIVAGRKELVRACYAQNGGIGRGMKVGKEGILGTVAALDAWSKRDHGAIRRQEEGRVALWQTRLSGLPGVTADLSPDPTGNPITRLRVHIGPGSGTTAWQLADRLAAGPRPVMVRDDEIEFGFFELDPCNLRDGEAEEAANRLVSALQDGRAGEAGQISYEAWAAEKRRSRLAWPDIDPVRQSSA